MIVREMVIRSSGSAGSRHRTALGTSWPDSSLSRIAPRSAPIDSKTSSRICGDSASMSRTLLIAWVARYITDRGISRSRSQPAAASGRLQDPRALARRDAAEDGRVIVGAAPRQQVHPRRQVALRPRSPPSWNTMTVWPSWTWSPESQRRPVDRLVVDDTSRWPNPG